ncbi:ABC transporter substrate-binding protein [Agromyces mediolanus]|uniref:ABC transporter substrate-binding protein n=1 Tax=Agromyces mediolanus TaxID=41986 RepID=UPI0038350260
MTLAGSTTARRAIALAAAAAATALLAACSGGADATTGSGADTVTVASAYGDVEVPTDPQRVAAVSYDTPWQLMSLDVQPIATIDYSQWADSYTPEQLDFIADAEAIGTFGEINFEALTAAAPDLIIGDAYEVDEATFARLEDIAPTVIVGGDADRGDWTAITKSAAAAVNRLDVWEADRAAYEALRDRTIEEYRDVIDGNVWINFSLGNDAGQFSVQLPSGSNGNLVVNEMGMAYGPGAASLTDAAGYASLGLEQLPTVFAGVTAAITFAQPDGTPYEPIQAIMDTELFRSLDVAKNDRVFTLSTSVTDYDTAQDWIAELTTNVLEPLAG